MDCRQWPIMLTKECRTDAALMDVYGQADSTNLKEIDWRAVIPKITEALWLLEAVHFLLG